MGKFSGLWQVSALSLLTVACVAPTPPVEVTRFHNAQQVRIATGSVAIVPMDAADPASLEHRTYAAAVMRELQRLGFSEARGDSSDYIATVAVERARIGRDGRRAPVSVGVGGHTGSYGSGIGVGVGIGLGGFGGQKARIATQLSVRIARRSDNAPLWEGRSSVEAKYGSPAAQPGLAASKLATALFKDFPGESGRTISVP